MFDPENGSIYTFNKEQGELFSYVSKIIEMSKYSKDVKVVFIDKHGIVESVMTTRDQYKKVILDRIADDLTNWREI